MKKYLPYIFIISAFLIILAPSLFAEGMFMDGLIYASVSRNLANGVGSFWNLHFTESLAPQFQGHPPLVMGIQSLFFRIFGDHFYVERLYSLLIGLLNGFLIFLITNKSFILNKTIVSSEELSNIKKYSWVSLLFWITIPLVAWSYSNNLLENTMLSFLLISTYLLIISFNKYRFLMLITASFSLFLALMSKGFVALFLWSFVPIYWLILRQMKFKRAFIDTIIVIIFTILPLALLLTFSPKAYETLMAYIDVQIVSSLSITNSDKNRFEIIFKLFNELLPVLIILLLSFLFLIIKKEKLKPYLKYKKEVLFFILIGLSASLPIAISLKQRGFYLTTSFPFFVIGFALLIIPFLQKKTSDLKFLSNKIIKFSIIGLFFVSIFANIYFWDTTQRDNNKVYDVKKVCEIVPENTTISICEQTYYDWSLHGYFARFSNISISDLSENKYLLLDKNCKDKDVVNYEKIDIELNNYFLFEKKY